jgi:hypothetical protein
MDASSLLSAMGIGRTLVEAWADDAVDGVVEGMAPSPQTRAGRLAHAAAVAATAAEKRTANKMALSEFIGARVVNAEEYEEQQQRLSALPSAATLTRCIEVQTDDLREHKLMELMRQVIESSSYQGALLRNDT